MQEFAATDMSEWVEVTHARAFFHIRRGRISVPSFRRLGIGYKMEIMCGVPGRVGARKFPHIFSQNATVS